MIRNLALIGLGVVLSKEDGRKALMTMAKNGSKMAINEIKKHTNFDLDKTLKELMKDDESMDGNREDSEHTTNSEYISNIE